MARKIGILMPHADVWQLLSGGLALMRRLGVEHEKAVASARVSPATMEARLRAMEDAGAAVVIAAGDEAEAATVAETHTLMPVVALPLAGVSHAAAALPLVEMAVLRAVRILAVGDTALAARLAGRMGERALELETQHRELARGGQTPAPVPKPAPRRPDPAPPAPAAAPSSAAPDPSRAADDMAELARLERAFEMGRSARRATAPAPRTPPPAPAAPPEPLRYTPAAQRVFGAARELARTGQNLEVGLPHFLAAMATTPGTAAWAALRECGADVVALADAARALLPDAAPGSGGLFALDADAEGMLAGTKTRARAAGRRWLLSADLLLALVRMDDTPAGALLGAHGVKAHAVERLLRDGFLPDEVAEVLETEPPAREPETVFEMDSDELTRIEAMLRDRTGAILPQPDDTAVPPHPAEEPYPRVQEPPLEPLPPLDEKPPRIVQADPGTPELEALETATTALLEGRIVAFPTDTGYVLGVDATNRDAVRRLFTLTGRDPGQPVGVLVHSTKQLRHMVRGFTHEVNQLAERFWPGPLTIVFDRHPRSFSGVSRDGTLGVRIPDNFVALALLSLLGRPLAMTGAEMPDGTPAMTGREVAAAYPPGIAVVLDAGNAGRLPAPTVLSVAGGALRMLREGAIPGIELGEILGPLTDPPT